MWYFFIFPITNFTCVRFTESQKREMKIENLIDN